MTASPNLMVEPTILDGVRILTPRRFGDKRGWFSETWNQATLWNAGIDLSFVQDNQSYSAERGVLRGLHFQIPPVAQDKLVRVLRGCILDIVVDLRRASATFGRHIAIKLSAENGRQLLIPRGFAHGFVTLEQNTEVFYKVSAPYSPEHDKGLAFDDPALGIDWGITPEEAIVSEKDTRHPRLADLPAWF